MAVAERPQLLVLLLPGRVPQRELDRFAVQLQILHVRLKHGGNVVLGKLVLFILSEDEMVTHGETRSKQS